MEKKRSNIFKNTVVEFALNDLIMNIIKHTLYMEWLHLYGSQYVRKTNDNDF